jgi:quinoprotein glucose dehydrogenase
MLGSVTLAEPVILRALNANFRLGKQENANAVATFAARGDASDVMRIEALAELAEWAKPRGIDRVVGVWRPLAEPTRDESIAKKAAGGVLASIVTSAPDSVRLAAIELIKKIGMEDPNVLLDLVMNKSTSPDVAAAALSAMESLKDPHLNDAVESALSNGKGALRGSAIRMLVSRPDATKRLEQLLAGGSIPDQQAVLATLGEIEQPAAQAILAAQLDKFVAGQLAPEIQLDLLDAAGKTRSEAIKNKLKEIEQKRPKDDPLATYAESLVGGDATVGKKIFYDRQDVSCMRCHKVDAQGGVAGPELTGVASRHDRKYLLESIVNPNAQIAPGFESVVVKVKAGKNYAGVVKGENDGEIVLDAGDGATVHITKKEVESRTKGLSPMPQDISKTLSKRDVRDVVEFLSSLKAPATQTAQSAK